MPTKNESHKAKHSLYTNRLPLITTTTLDQVTEEDEQDILDRRFRSSPLGTSHSAISLATLARESYTGPRPQILSFQQQQSPQLYDKQQTTTSPTEITNGTPSNNHINFAAWHSDQDDIPKAVKGRRNSFSSFLSQKYAKTKLQQDQERILPILNTNSRSGFGNGIDTHSSTKEFQKGHRPRSFSEQVIFMRCPRLLLIPFSFDRVPAVPAPVERAPPVAITNKTPIYEYYGFVMYLASFVVFGLYAIWAYVPDHILHDMGITYYPNRYWALAIPVWIMTSVWFTFICYITVNLMNTPPFDSYDCITDEHANIMEVEKMSLEDRPVDWMPELHDIPIGVVNLYLYQDENGAQDGKNKGNGTGFLANQKTGPRSG